VPRRRRSCRNAGPRCVAQARVAAPATATVRRRGVKKVAAFFSHLASFEPETKSQVSLHRATLSEFNTFFEYRRSRLYSVTAGIPPVMWYTVAVGALINVFMIWLFNLRLGTHLLLGGLISFFTGTMICLIALLDHPFRGEVAVSPQAFELIYNQMMQE